MVKQEKEENVSFFTGFYLRQEREEGGTSMTTIEWTRELEEREDSSDSSSCSLTVARHLIGWCTSSDVSIEPLSVRTATLIGHAIIQALNVRLAIGFGSVEIKSITVARARGNKITQTLAHIVIGEIMA